MIAALLLMVVTAAPEVARYDWYATGKPHGSLTRTSDGKGGVTVDYAYLDNGRGPKLKESFARDAKGTLTAYRVAGTLTLGAEVDEQFTLTGTAASWKATIDSGQRALTQPATYVAVAGTPEMHAEYVRAALKNKGKIDALPSGELTVIALRTESLTHGAKKAKITLYSIAGLDVAPVMVWLDEKQQLFADIDTGSGLYGTLAEGWTEEGIKLAALQKEAQAKRLEELGRTLRQRLEMPLAIKNVRVFDSRKGVLSTPRTVYIYRGRITAVVAAEVKISPEVAVVDGTGKTLLPALFDMHGHESPWSSVLQIAAGVTTVRDIGNVNDDILEMEAKYDARTWLGPRLWRAGFIEGESEFSARFSAVVASQDEAIAQVEWYAEHGYRQVKLYNSFNPDWIVATAKRAHELGMRVSGHVPAFTTAAVVATQGYDEIQHINMLMLNFLAKPKEDTRTPQRFYIVGERADSLDLQSPEMKAFIKLLKDHNVGSDPTLTAFEDMFTQGPGELSHSYGMVADHLPVAIQRSLLQNEMKISPENLEKFRAAYRKMVQLVGMLDKAGVTIVPGTDAIPGFALHREFELWVQAGMTPTKVLQNATLGCAKVLGLDRELGFIEPGASADVILVDGDPTTNISDVRKISLVIGRGDVFSPAQIYSAVGVKPFVPAATIVMPLRPAR